MTQTLKIGDVKTDVAVQKSYKFYLDSLGEFTKNDFVVTSDTIKPVSDTLKAIKLSINEIEARRKEITAPLDESKKRAMAQQKELVSPMLEIEKQLKGKVNIYLNEQRRLQEAEEERLRKIELERLEKERAEIEEQAVLNESEKALDDAIAVDEEIEIMKTAELTKKKTSYTTEFSGVHQRTKKLWKLVDINLVPDQYLTLNEKLIGANVRGGIKEIPGIKIWEERYTISK